MTAEPLDPGAVERSLTPGPTAPAEAPDWLRASWADPAPFWASLVALVDATSPVRTRMAPGRLGATFDPWHELVVRNLGLSTPALSWRDGVRGLLAMGWRELADRATRRALAWQRAGAAGAVCIVRPLGPELVVSVLAALKAGLVLTVLPPCGPLFVATRLGAAPCDFVDTDPAHRPLVTREAPVLPSSVDGDVSVELERSVPWRAGATAALLHDPTAAPGVRRAVTIDALLLGALRDGLLALSLRRGDVVTAPGFPALDVVPALPLAALACGATLLLLDEEDVRRDPRVLAGPLRAVGVGARVREVLLESPASQGWHGWFRSPAESLDLDRWQRFVQAQGLGDALASNLLWSASHGGCVLFSPRRAGRAHADVLPAAGATHTIVGFHGGTGAAPTGHGRLAVTPPGAAKPVVTPSVILPQRRGFQFGGSVVEGTGGRRFLTDEALRALDGLPGCTGASVCLTPVLGGGDRTADLLVFTGASEQGAPEVAAQVVAAARQRIAAALGAEHLPDRILCFPVLPRRTDAGAVDHAWCRDQYLSGGLARRADDPMQRLLTRIADQAGPPARTA